MVHAVVVAFSPKCGTLSLKSAPAPTQHGTSNRQGRLTLRTRMNRSTLWPKAQTALGTPIQGGYMPRQQTALAELGRVAVHVDQYRAHAKYRNSAGVNVHICGPDRSDRCRAETDLGQMRAAGAIGSSSGGTFTKRANSLKGVHLLTSFAPKLPGDIGAKATKFASGGQSITTPSRPCEPPHNTREPSTW